MFNFRYFLITLVIVGGLILAIGCAQTDDIIQSQEKATLTLSPQNLPTLDTSLYVYELWMVSDDVPTSLGKFIWDKDLYRFRDTNDSLISNQFSPPEAWYSYDYIMVTVENRPDPNPALPSGTIILKDDVVDPATRPISLKFPVSLFSATGFYFVGTPTDDTLNRYNEHRGIWLCSRTTSQHFYQDTSGFMVVDTIKPENSDTVPFELFRTQVDTINRSLYDPDTIGIDTAATIVYYNDTVVFGLDTIFNHIRIDVTWIDTVDTNFDYVIQPNYDTSTSRFIDYFLYGGPMTDLPSNIGDYGWRYNAWVFLEYPPVDANLPKMHPFGFDRQGFFVGDTSWAVLSLGTFASNDSTSLADSADMFNPYSDIREVPNFPGEDFLNNLPAGYDLLDFRLTSGIDPNGGYWGSIIVGLEPDPANLTIDSTRNFPLYFLGDFLFQTSYTGNFATFPLHNWSNFLPYIDVDVVFEE